MAEGYQERTETNEQEFRIVFLIGNGSRLASILDNVLDDPDVSVALVVSHRKPKEGSNDVVGIAEAKSRGIPTAYWNLIQMNLADKKFHPDTHDNIAYRATYMDMLGDFLSQEYYKPNLIVMTGWDLILDDNIVSKIRNSGARIINVHPHPLPGNKDDEIEAPDGTKTKVHRGLEVWRKVIEAREKWSGATVHEVVSADFDVGPVVMLDWVKIEPGETVEHLRERLNVIEDRIAPEAIKKIKKEIQSA